MSDAILTSIKKNYHPRLVDQRLAELLGTFGCVLITGPKWCGKSWTAVKACSSAVFVDEGDNAARAMILPDSILAGATPRLIDEWQDAPPLWDAARRLVDTRHKPGQFIFTGSTTIKTTPGWKWTRSSRWRTDAGARSKSSWEPSSSTRPRQASCA